MRRTTDAVCGAVHAEGRPALDLTGGVWGWGESNNYTLRAKPVSTALCLCLVAPCMSAMYSKAYALINMKIQRVRHALSRHFRTILRLLYSTVPHASQRTQKCFIYTVIMIMKCRHPQSRVAWHLRGGRAVTRLKLPTNTWSSVINETTVSLTYMSQP